MVFLPTIAKNYGKSEVWAEKNLKRELNDPRKYLFGIWYHGELIGSVGFHSLGFFSRISGEIQYWISKDYLGKGIATLACLKLIDIGINGYLTKDSGFLHHCIQ